MESQKPDWIIRRKPPELLQNIYDINKKSKEYKVFTLNLS